MRGVHPETPLFPVFLRNLQPFTPPDTLDPLVVDAPTCVVQQAGHHPIAVAPVFVGQFDDVVAQTLLIYTALRNLALRGSMLTERAAGPLSSIAWQSTAGQRGALICQAPAAHGRCPCGDEKRSDVSLCRLGQNELVQRQIRHRATQPLGLLLKLFQACKL